VPASFIRRLCSARHRSFRDAPPLPPNFFQTHNKLRATFPHIGKQCWAVRLPFRVGLNSSRLRVQNARTTMPFVNSSTGRIQSECHARNTSGWMTVVASACGQYVSKSTVPALHVCRVFSRTASQSFALKARMGCSDVKDLWASMCIPDIRQARLYEAHSQVEL
jgi:hypothetical protein